ncbi:hypothetical protein BSKO_05886 [Bryopsis sp. KO-2023]|nr:hypothetical protein BSKO_05886 [Bryopsis sp. KO-2023]
MKAMFFGWLIFLWLCVNPALVSGREIINRDKDDLDGIERQLLQKSSFEGTLVDANRFPYVVSIRQANGAHLCSGVLIFEDWVLTAARCWAIIFDYPLVYIGVQNAGVESVRQEVRLATKMIPELGSSPEQHSTPLGLIHLNASVDVPLPRLSSKSANPNEKLQLLGFGNQDKANANLFDEMRMETHVVQNQEICEEKWGPSELGETSFCSLGDNGLSSCIADSGSPVIRPSRIRGGDPSMDPLVGIVTGGGICEFDKEKPETIAIDVFKRKDQLLSEIQMEEEEVEVGEEEEKESWLKGHWWIFLLVGLAFVLGSGYLVQLNWKNWFPPSLPPEPWLLVEDSARTSEDYDRDGMVSPFEDSASRPEGMSVFPIVSRSLRVTRLCQSRKIIDSGQFGIVEKGQFVDAAGVTHDVAVKTANIQTLGQDTESFRFVLESFRAEIECFERISSHPNIIRCFGGRVGTPVDDSAMDFNEIFIVEELMDTNLRKIITGERTPWERWTYKTMLRIFRDIAKGLEHLHTHNVSHYDLKPENVLVKVVDEVFPLQIKLADFGCSQIKQETYATAKLAGTRQYMAPEIAWSHHFSLTASGKVDVYSLGILMWEILTGGNLMSRVAQTVEGVEPPTIEDFLEIGSAERWPIADHHPLELSQLIWSCVEFDSPKRPTTKMVLQTIERLMAAEWATDETVREAIVIDKPSAGGK